MALANTQCPIHTQAMDPFKRNYHTDDDLADPLELTGTWEGIARRTYIRCKRFQIALGEPLITRLEQDPGWRTERWDCAHSPNIVAPQRVIAAVVGMR